MVTATIIKCGKRSVRRYCPNCGAGGPNASHPLWWGHDTSRTGTAECRDHGTGVSLIMVEEDGSVHPCTAQADYFALKGAAKSHKAYKPATASKPPTAPVQAPTVPVQAPATAPAAPAATPVANGQAHAPAARLDAIQALLDLLAPKVDAEQVNAIIDARLRTLDDLAVPFRVEVKKPDGTVKPVKGTAHPILPRVIRAVNAGMNVLMVGPAGTGKSTLALQVAEALDLTFYPFSVGPMTSKSDLVGYMNATGDYVDTIVYRAFKFGGLLLIDELDAGNPGVFTGLNAMLANGHMAFPNGEIVERHPDFRCVAAANTYGRGPDRMYVGRQAMDAATMDRFYVITVDIDEMLERSVCLATGLAQPKVDAILAYTRKLRNAAADARLAVVVSPRGSRDTCKGMVAGDTLREAIDSALRKGISDGDWRKITADATVPTF